MVAEVPLRVVAVEIILGKGRCGVTCRVEADARVDTLLSWDYLRHDAESSVGKLLDAPELLISTGVGRNSLHFAVSCSCQCALGALDGNLEIGITEVGTLTLYGRRAGMSPSGHVPLT